MALEMKPNCLKCDTKLALDGEAWICSHECTFCTPCYRSFDGVCPNCAGELKERPRRVD